MKWRFILFVFVVAFLPSMLAVLTTGDVALRAESRLEDRLSGSLSALTSRFEADAARRRELLLRMSARDGLVEAVRDAARAGTAPEAAAVVKLRAAVGELMARDVPDLVAIATANGAQAVLASNEPRALATADLPLAGPTIRDGQIGETLALFEGALFRFHAAPVGIADGVIVIGDKVGENTANRWRDAAKAQHLTLVNGGQPVVSTLPEALRAEVAKAAENPSIALQTGWLGTGIAAFSFVDSFFPFMVPGARWRSAGMRLPGGVYAIVTIGTDQELGWLGRMQAFALLLTIGMLLGGLLWVPVIYGTVERQSRSIEAHLARLRVEREAKLNEKGFTKPFASVARELDRLTDDWHRTMAAVTAFQKDRPTQAHAAPADAPRPIPRPLDLPLAPAPEKEPDSLEGTPSAFNFGEKVGGLVAGGALDQIVEVNVGKTATALPKVSIPAPVRGGRSLATAESLDPPAEPEIGGPIPLPAPPSAKADPFAAFGPAQQPEASDRTREAMIPEELLARSRELEQELLESPADPDEDHFREVFEEFVATRKKCGEAPDGLTLDKFIARLKKNREQLVAKYACKTVRFQVYVKDGKAAVKAAPVR